MLFFASVYCYCSALFGQLSSNFRQCYGNHASFLKIVCPVRYNANPSFSNLCTPECQLFRFRCHKVGTEGQNEEIIMLFQIYLGSCGRGVIYFILASSDMNNFSFGGVRCVRGCKPVDMMVDPPDPPQFKHRF